MKYTTRQKFPAALPQSKIWYCWHCGAAGAQKTEGGYMCTAYGHTEERVLIYDPNMAMSFDEKDRLVHESAGVIVVRDDGKVLLFKRTKFPRLLTIPAGHIEVGENALVAASREMEEEIGVSPEKLVLLFDGDIAGDSCVGGADIHHWHAYGYKMEGNEKVHLDEEGSSWGWYTSHELSEENTVMPVLYLLRQNDVVEGLRGLRSNT